jgi:anti-sigma factor RsiW
MTDASTEHVVRELLPWYLTGTLDPDEAAAFRDHLAGCAECREEAEIHEKIRSEIARHGKAFLEDHPSAERLVDAVSGALAAEDEAAVRRHLALCDACAREASWAAGEAVAGSEAARRVRPVRWGWVAAAAAAVIAVILLLPWRGSAGRATRLVQADFVRPSELATERPNVFRALPGQDAVRLVFEVDLDPEAFPVTLEIVRADGTAVFRESAIARDRLLDGAYLLLDCSLRDCASGSYRARIVPPSFSQPPLELRFEIAE